MCSTAELLVAIGADLQARAQGRGDPKAGGAQTMGGITKIAFSSNLGTWKEPTRDNFEPLSSDLDLWTIKDTIVQINNMLLSFQVNSYEYDYTEKAKRDDDLYYTYKISSVECTPINEMTTDELKWRGYFDRPGPYPRLQASERSELKVFDRNDECTLYWRILKTDAASKYSNKPIQWWCSPSGTRVITLKTAEYIPGMLRITSSGVGRVNDVNAEQKSHDLAMAYDVQEGLAPVSAAATHIPAHLDPKWFTFKEPFEHSSELRFSGMVRKQEITIPNVVYTSISVIGAFFERLGRPSKQDQSTTLNRGCLKGQAKTLEKLFCSLCEAPHGVVDVTI